MFDLLPTILSNVVVALAIGIIALVVGRFLRHPAMMHAVWVLVLVKLVTPPIICLPWLPQAGVSVAEVEDRNVAVSRMDSSESLGASDFISDSGGLMVGGPAIGGPAIGGPDVDAEIALDPEQRYFNFADKRFRGLTRNDIYADVFDDTDREAFELRASEGRVDSEAIHEEDTKQSASWYESWSAVGLVNAWKPYWPIFLLIQVLGTIFVISRSVLRNQKFKKIIKLAQYRKQVSQHDVHSRVVRIAQRMQLNGEVEVVIVDGILSPMVWPSSSGTKLVLPQKLLKSLSQAQLDSLIAHELSHLLCRHHWFRWFELAVFAVYWWCPLVWLACNKLRQYEEETCDAWVVSLMPGHAKSYANLLLETVDYLSDTSRAMPSTALGFSHFHSLKRRITMIMNGQSQPRMSFAGWSALIAIVAFGFPFSLSYSNSANAGESSIQDRDDRRDDQDDRARSRRNRERQEREDRRDSRTRERRQDNSDRRDRDQQDEDIEIDIDQDDVKEMVSEITQELKGIDKEIQEALEEVREELQEALGSDMPASVLKALKDMNIGKMIDENVREMPKSIQKFVEEIDIESIIDKAVKRGGKSRDGFGGDIDIAEEEIQEELAGELKELTSELRGDLSNLQGELRRELGGLPGNVKKMLKEMNIAEVIEQAASEASPLGQQVLEDLNIREVIENALSEKRGRRREIADAFESEEELQEEEERRSRDRSDREMSERNRAERMERFEREMRRRRPDREEVDDRRAELEQKVEMLMAEVQALRQELRKLDPERFNQDRDRVNRERERVERDRELNRRDRDKAESDRTERRRRRDRSDDRSDDRADDRTGDRAG